VRFPRCVRVASLGLVRGDFAGLVSNGVSTASSACRLAARRRLSSRLHLSTAAVTGAIDSADSDMTHGTRSGYNNGCRCPLCTEANTAASRARRERIAGRSGGVRTPEPQPCSRPYPASHGTTEVARTKCHTAIPQLVREAVNWSDQSCSERRPGRLGYVRTAAQALPGRRGTVALITGRWPPKPRLTTLLPRTGLDSDSILPVDHEWRETLTMTDEANPVEWARHEAARLRRLTSPVGSTTETAAAVELLARYAPGSTFHKIAAAHTQFNNLKISYVAGALEQWVRFCEDGLATGLPFAAQARVEAASDLMDQAEQLLEDGSIHPAAAAMLIGAALEELLRSMCIAETVMWVGKPGIASYADALRAQDLISKQDHKDITSWGGQRNNAAHGNFDLVQKPRVRLMADGVNLFMQGHSLTATS